MGQDRSFAVIWRLALSAGLICIAMMLSPVQAWAVDCGADQLVEMPAGSWLVISQVTLTAEPCPPEGEELGDTFPFRSGDTVYIFLRLQGNLDLLEHVRSSDQLRIVLRKSDGIQETTYRLDLGESRITLPAARAEASLAERNGQFDWRFYARIRAFARPSRYSLTLTYGGRPLCQLDGSCSISFAVQ